jgi:TRAP-type mannitol/chloroaromatic compound transport system substrate-binding protein
MFQALQTGALDAGEFIGPWTDSALGYYQVAPNYYWPGVGEPSSAEECGVNAAAYAELPDDLKQVVALACESLYNPVWTEYTTKHAQSLKTLVESTMCMVRKLPDDVIAAMGAAAGGHCWNTAPTMMSWSSASPRASSPIAICGRLHDLCRQRPDERPRGVFGY